MNYYFSRIDQPTIRSQLNSRSIKLLKDENKRVGLEISKHLEKRDLLDALLKKEHDQPSADQDKEHDQTSTSKSQEKKNLDHKHKDHLGFTEVCVIRLNLKKSKSYHIILKTNVSSLFLSIQDIV